MKQTGEGISKWIFEKVKEAGANGIVLGLSGGVDSATVAVLSKMAVNDNVLGLIMPIHNDPEDERHVNILAEKFGIKTIRIDLTPIYDNLLKILPEGSKIAQANLRPRLRMATLYFFANLNNYLVAGTGNKSEELIGYFTKYGDGGVDILPIGDLLKTEVWKLARELGVPKEIVEKTPSAGLWPGQTDEDEMGIKYNELDKILEGIEKSRLKGLDKKMIELIKEKIEKSEHKRRQPEICKI